MSSIECQLAQGCVGDLIVIRGKDANGKTIPVRLTSDVVLGPDKRPRWKKGGEPTVFTGDRQLWWSRHDPDFKELLDTRGKNDVESPLGEWTRVECLCDGERITVRVNGTTVNECYDVFPAAGKILLQSEGFELFVRKFELHPLNPIEKGARRMRADICIATRVSSRRPPAPPRPWPRSRTSTRPAATCSASA